jgi:hypothetical protein
VNGIAWSLLDGGQDNPGTTSRKLAKNFRKAVDRDRASDYIGLIGGGDLGIRVAAKASGFGPSQEGLSGSRLFVRLRMGVAL